MCLGVPEIGKHTKNLRAWVRTRQMQNPPLPCRDAEMSVQHMANLPAPACVVAFDRLLGVKTVLSLLSDVRNVVYVFCPIAKTFCNVLLRRTTLPHNATDSSKGRRREGAILTHIVVGGRRRNMKTQACQRSQTFARHSNAQSTQTNWQEGVRADIHRCRQGLGESETQNMRAHAEMRRRTAFLELGSGPPVVDFHAPATPNVNFC